MSKKSACSSISLNLIYIAALVTGLIVLIIGVAIGRGVDNPNPTHIPVPFSTNIDTPAMPVTVTVTLSLPLTNTFTSSSTAIATPTDVVMDNVPIMFVPEGKFIMGNDAGDKEDKPAHEVYLSSFYIDKYEVTNSLYRRCVTEGVCLSPTNFSSETRPSYFDNSQYDNFPAIWVDWDMARNFCEWRGMRLPTDAEWEKAARGLDTRRYPWGEGYDCNYANFSPKGIACIGDTAEVGTYSANTSPYGVYDMAGNVWEWVQDWFAEDYYLESPLDNPTGPSQGTQRVRRGGAWLSEYYHMTTFNRDRQAPAGSARSIGFRCACSPGVDACPAIP